MHDIGSWRLQDAVNIRHPYIMHIHAVRTGFIHYAGSLDCTKVSPKAIVVPYICFVVCIVVVVVVSFSVYVGGGGREVRRIPNCVAPSVQPINFVNCKARQHCIYGLLGSPVLEGSSR